MKSSIAFTEKFILNSLKSIIKRFILSLILRFTVRLTRLRLFLRLTVGEALISERDLMSMSDALLVVPSLPDRTSGVGKQSNFRYCSQDPLLLLSFSIYRSEFFRNTLMLRFYSFSDGLNSGSSSTEFTLVVIPSRIPLSLNSMKTDVLSGAFWRKAIIWNSSSLYMLNYS